VARTGTVPVVFEAATLLPEKPAAQAAYDEAAAIFDRVLAACPAD
jgi:hypothetical protein